MVRLVTLAAVWVVTLWATIDTAEAARSRKIEIPILSSTPAANTGTLKRVRYRVEDRISFEREIETSIGYFGVQVRAVEEEPFLGLIVERIERESPAAICGLSQKDRLLEINGETVSTERRFRYLVQTHDVHQPFTMRVLRQGKSIDLIAQLASRTVKEQDVEVYPIRSDRDRQHTGATFGAIEGKVARYFYTEEERRGVMITKIAPGTPFFFSDLRAGDLIVTLDDQAVSDPADAIRVFERAARRGERVRITVSRGRAMLSQEVRPDREIGDGFRVDIPIVVSWTARPAETNFELVWGLVFDYEWSASYDRSGEPRFYRGWSLPLNLIEYENKAGAKKFGLLWFINFRW